MGTLCNDFTLLAELRSLSKLANLCIKLEFGHAFLKMQLLIGLVEKHPFFPVK